MTENEAIEELKLIKHTRIFIPSDEVWEMAIHALSEIQQYRTIGTIEELQALSKNAKEHKEEPYAIYETVRSDRLDCEVPSDYFGQIKEVRVIDEWTEEEKVFKEAPKELCIATMKINKEDMQELVDQKVKEIELDIQAIRNKAIDEFAEQMKNKLVLRYGNATATEQYVAMQATDWCNEIAEQLKAGGIDE